VDIDVLLAFIYSHTYMPPPVFFFYISHLVCPKSKLSNFILIKFIENIVTSMVPNMFTIIIYYMVNSLKQI
jgi:hypothetical protein